MASTAHAARHCHQQRNADAGDERHGRDKLRCDGSRVAAMAVAPPSVSLSPISAMPTRISRTIAQFRPLPAPAVRDAVPPSMPGSTAHMTGLKGDLGSAADTTPECVGHAAPRS